MYIKNPDIVAFSNFVWNTKINHRVAKTIKELYPNCLIIFGGLGNPNKKNVKAYLKQHDYIDLIVNGEGEITFEHILSSYLHGRSYEEISGLSSKNFITKDRDRIKDIDTMPSPYLDGLFELIQNNCQLQVTVLVVADEKMFSLANIARKPLFQL